VSSERTSTSRTEGELSGQAKDTAAKVKEQAQQKASEIAGRVQEQATNQIASRKESAAQSLGGVAQAMRQTGQQLRDQDQVGLTGYIEQAADQVERFSSYLQNKELGDLVGDVERFARRQPALFLGGAFLAGLIGARFLKSSRPHSQYEGQYGYNRYSGGSGEYYGGYRGIYGSGMGGAYSPGVTYSGAGSQMPGMYDAPTERELERARRAERELERNRRDEQRTRSVGEGLGE
jgi:hypothetical protein